MRDMISKRNRVIVMCVAAILGLVVGWTAAGGEGTQRNELRTAVEQFMDSEVGRLRIVSEESVPHGEYVIVTCDKGEFYVEKTRGTVGRAEFEAMLPRDSAVSIEEALQTATEFISRRYPDFDLRNFQLIRKEKMDHAFSEEYLFVWNELIGDVRTFNTVATRVDAGSGEVCTYMAVDIPVSISLSPKTDEWQAVKQAEEILAVVPEAIESYLYVKLMADGTQRLVWVVTVVSHDELGFSNGGVIAVDATTGDVVDVARYA